MIIPGYLKNFAEDVYYEKTAKNSKFFVPQVPFSIPFLQSFGIS